MFDFKNLLFKLDGNSEILSTSLRKFDNKLNFYVCDNFRIIKAS